MGPHPIFKSAQAPLAGRGENDPTLSGRNGVVCGDAHGFG